MEWPSVVFIFVGVTQMVSGYHSGAPLQACTTMTPGHPASPQNGPSPYRILLPKSEWKAGEVVEITLTAAQSGPPFMGFLAQVRPKGQDTPVGTFKMDGVKGVACGGNQGSAVTHTGPETKNQVKLMWTPPAESEAKEYEVIVTFVKDLNTFWVKEKPQQVVKIGASTSGKDSPKDSDKGTNNPQPGKGTGSHFNPASLWSSVLFSALVILSAKYYYF